MPVLQPFRAFHPASGARRVFIPGQGADPAFASGQPLNADSEHALYLYRQEFLFPGDEHLSVREGITGVLDSCARKFVFPHEETSLERVNACVHTLNSNGLETSSLFLACEDEGGAIRALLKPQHPPDIASDTGSGTYTVWRIVDPNWIASVNQALRDRPLFLVDGHHRFAAGWQLATVFVRTPALRTLPAHRLVLAGDPVIPALRAIDDPDAFWRSTPQRYARFVVLMRDGSVQGFELPRAPGERNLCALHRSVLPGTTVQPARSVEGAWDSVRSGLARMAILVEPLEVDTILEDAWEGRLLPPKSTDFYPKLAGGLVLHQHQNETAIPPVAQMVGVRNPSS